MSEKGKDVPPPPQTSSSSSPPADSAVGEACSKCQIPPGAHHPVNPRYLSVGGDPGKEAPMITQFHGHRQCPHAGQLASGVFRLEDAEYLGVKPDLIVTGNKLLTLHRPAPDDTQEEPAETETAV